MAFIDKISALLVNILSGVPITLVFIISSWILGFILSIFVTIGSLSKLGWLKRIISIYISFTRSVPIILQLFLVYYGLPMLLSEAGIDLSGLDKMYFCISAYVLYYGAYLSEVLRPAYLSVNASQRETGLALGYTRFEVETKIVIPQAVPIALPSLGNEAINLVHQSSILFVIGVTDVMGVADSIIAEDYTASPLLTYFVAGLVYWVLTALIIGLIKIIEKQSGKFLTA